MTATRADRVAAQHAEYLGATPLDKDTTGLADDLQHDWQASWTSHLWERIRRPLFPRCRSIGTDGHRCQHRTLDGTHPGEHGHYDEQEQAVYSWPNLEPGARRPSTPDRYNPKTRTTTVRMKRCCNGCGAQLGDATEIEVAYGMYGLQLPDVTGECRTCSTAKAALAA